MLYKKTIRLITLIFIFNSSTVNGMLRVIKLANSGPLSKQAALTVRSVAHSRSFFASRPRLTRSVFSTVFQKSSENSSKTKRFLNRSRWSLAAVTGAALAYIGFNDAQIAKDEPQKKITCDDILAERVQARDNFYKMLEAKPWGNVCKKYIKQLRAEETEIINEFLRLLTINHEEFEKHKKRISHEIEFNTIEDSSIPIPTHLKGAVQGFINNYAPNLRNIEIQLFKSDTSMFINGFYPKTILALTIDTIPSAYLADTYLHGYYLDCPQSALLQAYDEYHHKTVHEFEVMLLHELQHILHSDTFHGSTLEIFIPKTHLLLALQKKYKKFQEKRADILAALVDPKYAQRSSMAFKRFYDSDEAKINKEFEYDGHPTDLERYTLAQKIYEEIQPLSVHSYSNHPYLTENTNESITH